MPVFWPLPRSPTDQRWAETYFADLLKTHSRSTIKRDRNGLQRYFEHVLEIDWNWVLIVKPPIVKSLPDILSPDEINRVFTIEFPSQKVMDEFFADPEYLVAQEKHFANSVASITVIAMYQKHT